MLAKSLAKLLHGTLPWHTFCLAKQPSGPQPDTSLLMQAHAFNSSPESQANVGS